MIDAQRVDFVVAPTRDLERAIDAIRVPNVVSARAELEGAGVEFTGETIDSGVCQIAFFGDADGNGLLSHHRYAPK